MRLIALDLDGTLLNDEKELTEENRKALAECMERGIYIVPTTGRTLEGIPAEIKNIPGIRYAITVNGGRIMDKDQNITIDSRLLTREQALQVIDIAEEYPVMYDAYVNGRGVSESRFLDHLEEYGISGAGLKSIRAVRDAYPNIRDHIETCGEMVEKHFLDSLAGDANDAGQILLGQAPLLPQLRDPIGHGGLGDEQLLRNPRKIFQFGNQ